MSDMGIFATPVLGPVSSFVPGSLGKGSSEGTASPVNGESRNSSFSSAFGDKNPFAMMHHQHHHQHPHHLQQHQQAQQAQEQQTHLQTPPAHHHHHHHHHAHQHQHPNASLYGPSNPPPISISESDKVFVFGPEGETGARSAAIFAGRRRVHTWRKALAPLGMTMAQKVGVELGNGPPAGLWA